MKISIYIATSANGFISNSRNVPDWLSLEYGNGMVSICQKYQAVIMGRTTYNILVADHLPLQTEGTTVVLTTDEQAKSDNSTVVFTKDKATSILKVNIETASAKIRTGLLHDLDLSVWVDVLPLATNAGKPVDDPNMRNKWPLPKSVRSLITKHTNQKNKKR